MVSRELQNSRERLRFSSATLRKFCNWEWRACTSLSSWPTVEVPSIRGAFPGARNLIPGPFPDPWTLFPGPWDWFRDPLISKELFEVPTSWSPYNLRSPNFDLH
jgi:hypothetical protein